MKKNDQWQQLLARIKANDLKLVKLTLPGHEVDDLRAVELANACKTNTVLKKLKLSENNIGVDGLKAFAEMLSTNYTLISLKLNCNNINDLNAKLFVSSLKQNPIITTLSLYPEKSSKLNSSIIAEIKILIEENKNCCVSRLLSLIKQNDPTFAAVDVSLMKSDRVSLYNETFKNEFKKAVSENNYIRKFIFSLDNLSILEFCPIISYPYIQRIEIKEAVLNRTVIEQLSRMLNQLTTVLDSNKNLTSIQFPKSLLDYRRDKVSLIECKIQENLKNNIENKTELLSSLIAIIQGLKGKPLGELPYHLLFHVLDFVFAKNVVYQQMVRKKTFFPFFSSLKKTIMEKKIDKNTPIAAIKNG